MSLIHKFSNSKQLFVYISDYIKQQNIAQKKFNLAISGGNTPGKLFEYFQKSQTIDFAKTCVFQTDERFTPATNNLSNQFSAIQFFDSLQFKKSFLPFDVSQNYNKCCQDYAQKLANINIDLSLLGFGLDGHFASIFPGFDDFETTDKVLQTTAKNNYPVPQRLTLSPYFISQSKKIFVVLVGLDKISVLEEFEKNSLSRVIFPANFWRDFENVEILFTEQ